MPRPVQLQGRFKKQLLLDELVTGQVFTKPMNVPGQWLLNAVQALIRQLSPSATTSKEQTWSMLMPVIASAQAIHACKPEDATAPSPLQPQEDLHLVHDIFRTKEGMAYLPYLSFAHDMQCRSSIISSGPCRYTCTCREEAQADEQKQQTQTSGL